MLKINVDSANVTCPTASLSRHMLSTKLFTMHFATVGFRKFMGRVKINFFDVLDKYEYWKGKVWNQFLVSSVLVSLRRNKGTQSDLGAPFCPPPPAGGTGGPSSGSDNNTSYGWRDLWQSTTKNNWAELTAMATCDIRSESWCDDLVVAMLWLLGHFVRWP